MSTISKNYCIKRNPTSTNAIICAVDIGFSLCQTASPKDKINSERVKYYFCYSLPILFYRKSFRQKAANHLIFLVVLNNCVIYKLKSRFIFYVSLTPTTRNLKRTFRLLFYLAKVVRAWQLAK